MKNQKYLIAAGVAALFTGAALYYLSYNHETIKYDKNKHTLERLRKIVKEIFIESATILC